MTAVVEGHRRAIHRVARGDLPPAHPDRVLPLRVPQLDNLRPVMVNSRPYVLGEGQTSSVVLLADTHGGADKACVIGHGVNYRPEAWANNIDVTLELHDQHVPGILPIEQHGVDRDGEFPLPYMIMPVAQGTLLERTREKPLTPSELVVVSGQLSETLTAMHNHDEEGNPRGVSHGDYKAGNILLLDGRSYTTDYEGAAPIDGMRHTHMQVASATAAPEQFDGFVSDRSDGYQLGLVLYQAATGVPLWNGMGLNDRAEIIRSGKHDSYVLERLSDLPSEHSIFVPAFARELRLDSSQRFVRSANFAAELSFVLEESKS